MASSFEMIVKDFFKFKDGRTVFVGPIKGSEKFISPCKCDLWVQGVKYETINIEGEMIPEGKRYKEYRVVSTKDGIDLEDVRMNKLECRLVGA